MVQQAGFLVSARRRQGAAQPIVARVLKRQDLAQHQGVDIFDPRQGDDGRLVQRTRIKAQPYRISGQQEAEDLALTVGQDTLAARPSAQDQARRGGSAVRIERLACGHRLLEYAQPSDQGAFFIAQSGDGGEIAQGGQIGRRGYGTAHADRARHHALAGRRDPPPPAVRLPSLSHTISGVPPDKKRPQCDGRSCQGAETLILY